MKLIIDATTGTVLSADDCYLVDSEALSDIERDELENGSDSDIANVAKVSGAPLRQIGQDTGWGDNKYRFSVSYSPLSLRDEADAMIDGGIYDSPEDDEYLKVLEWAKDEATKEQLEEIADFIMGDDHVWDGFRERLMEGLVLGYREARP